MKLSQERPMKISSGFVFDIKRFAIHDGQGIRTTVFFKGCPLRCRWCQNPEGLNPKPQIIYLEKNCIHCQSCVNESKKGGVELKEGKIRISRNRNEDWDSIVDACPTMALRYDARKMEVADVIEEIEKDQAFFKYGGGVTISGGEPFYQVDFLEASLKEMKRRGIHTAIETTFFTKTENVKRVLPYLDQIYCDCKFYNSRQHQAYTNVSNDIILKNIEYVLKSEKKNQVIVRIPLIPTMTATKDNLEAISRFLYSCYDQVHVELLNYNPLAKAKYAYLDMDYCFEENPKLYRKEEMEGFYQVLKENGIKNLVIE